MRGEGMTELNLGGKRGGAQCRNKSIMKLEVNLLVWHI